MESEIPQRIRNHRAESRPAKGARVGSIDDHQREGKQPGGEGPDDGSAPCLRPVLGFENPCETKRNNKDNHCAHQVLVSQTWDRTA